VKPCSADGTGVTPGRVGRRHIIQNPAHKAGFFAFYTFGFFIPQELLISFFILGLLLQFCSKTQVDGCITKKPQIDSRWCHFGTQRLLY
ncbi:hypothetical protein, partial [Algoriphagus lacus]|uniref:hypothetical protein n=1 Tax=Algoriphagus lacus TaxID=2056311 RepID=UPI001F24A041